jgi:hypothetical protein
MIWEAYGHLQPSQVLTVDGVPIVSVYLRTRPSSPGRAGLAEPDAAGTRKVDPD